MSLNFVAAEDGLEDGPKFLQLARLLKVPRSIAFWSVMRLRRLITNEGNKISGALPKSYTRDDIAAFLEWTGKPGALIDALKATGWLGFRRARGFFYPSWGTTVTGRYAASREAVRAYDRRRKRDDREVPGGGERENPENVSVRNPYGLRTESVPVQRSIKERNPDGTPPTPPPEGGDSLADARWQWVEEHAPNPRNSGYCRKILARMSAEKWEMVQRAWGPPRPEWGPLYVRHARVLLWPSDAFLRKEAFLPWGKKPARRIARASSAAVKVVDPAEQLARQLAEQDRYVLEASADPDLPEGKKRELQEWWRARPENAERIPPWEKNGHHQGDA